MALIICPECQSQISDTAAACPKCGYSMLHIVKTEEQIKKTPLGELKKNTTKGVIMIVSGVIFLAVGALLALVIIGWPLIILGFFLLVLGVSAARGGHSITCPYCGATGLIAPNALNYKCNACKRVSVRDGNEVKTVL